MREPAPIAMFVYNRPGHTEQTLESLAACDGFAESRLYVFCDGPRDERDEVEVAATRRMLRSFRLPNVTVVEHRENLGLADSTIAGISEVVERHGQVIMVEDDYLLSPWFLDFLNRALERYRHEERVMQVSGYCFPTDARLPESFFLRPAFGACWGMATWKRAWRRLETRPEALIARLTRPERRFEYELRGTTRFFHRLQAQLDGKVDSWTTRWYASIFVNEGLTLRPRRSLLSNTGNDGTGNKAVETDAFDVEVTERPVRGFPRKVEENERALEAAIEFHQQLHRRTADKLHHARADMEEKGG